MATRRLSGAGPPNVYVYIYIYDSQDYIREEPTNKLTKNQSMARMKSYPPKWIWNHE